MMLAAVVLCLIAVLGTGAIATQVLRVRLHAGAAFLLGCLALVFAAAWLDLLRVPLTRATWIALAAPGWMAAVWCSRRARPFLARMHAAWRELTPLATGVLLCGAIVGLMIVCQALAVPMEGFDARYIWAFKAKALFTEHTLYSPPFLDPLRPHLHRSYPPAIAWLESFPATIAGAFDDRALKLLFPPFLWVLAAMVFAGARRIGLDRSSAMVWAVLVACWPPFFRHDFGGAAHDGYTDLPLAAAYAGATLWLIEWRDTGRWRDLVLCALCAAFAAYVKREGQLAAAVILVAVVVHAWRRRAVLAPFLFAGVVVLLLVPHVAYLRALPLPEAMSVPPAPDEDYSALFAQRGVLAVAKNLPAVAAWFARLPFGLPMGASGFLAALVVVAAMWRRPRVPHAALLFWLVAAPVACYIVALALQPFASLEFHLGTASTRLWMHVTGALVLLLAGFTRSGD
ncbi:MAG: glycosyltransferase family 39 protein [Planctomycetota bacterium]